jgi:hypothetical protein
VDVNKSHDDNNGGGQRTRFPQKKVMNCSVAKKSVKRVR